MNTNKQNLFKRRWPGLAAPVPMPALDLHGSAVRDIQTTTLKNGLRIVTEVMPSVRSVSLGIWVGSGSRIEQGSENGLSHFLEHMVFKGTEHRSAEDIAISVDSIGGGLDAFTSKELVSFNTKVLDEHVPVAVDVLADMVLNPLFRAEDIEKEKGVILEEIKAKPTSPNLCCTRCSSAISGRGTGSASLFSALAKR